MGLKGASIDLLVKGKNYADTIVRGLNKSPSQFHAVQYCKQKLLDFEFKELKEAEQWTLQGGEKYFFTRN